MSYQKEICVKDSTILPIHEKLNFIQGSLSVCVIEYDCYSGTGFFIKFRNETNINQYQYFLMTCHHVIGEDLYNIDIKILYHYARIQKIIKLNNRFIKYYSSSNNVDIAIIEIKPEDNIIYHGYIF